MAAIVMARGRHPVGHVRGSGAERAASWFVLIAGVRTPSTATPPTALKECRFGVFTLICHNRSARRDLTLFPLRRAS
ncbi:hypothetical protein [Burkholderia territorii]|uniref:hypothetical protein n=1 Tax=Burkholderia territorii TaxID=1503055 RepID=UPI000A5F6A64|nr:hypothetical protein [Burkholderia territorii]